MKYIYCNVTTIELGSLFNVMPLEVSHVLWEERWHSYLVAGYESLKKLEEIPERELVRLDAWWREVGRANISIDDIDGLYGLGYKPRIARKVGLLLYICDQWGASTEKNVAAMIGEMANHEGKTPVELFNSFDKL